MSLFKKDLDAFFEHADEVVLSGKTIKAFFDDVTDHLSKRVDRADFHTTAEISTPYPMLTCKTCDATHARKGDLVNIEGVEYTVYDPKPNGTGITYIELKKR